MVSSSTLTGLTVLTTLLISVATAQQDAIDFAKARGLLDRFNKGEELDKSDSEYLTKAKAAFQKKQANPKKVPMVSKPSIGLTPLTDLNGNSRYKGLAGGLYGHGENRPPQAHLNAGLNEAAMIVPLDDQGKPNPTGRVVLVSLGMSNTTQEFSEFMRLTKSDASISPNLMIVDGAQGGMEASAWSVPGKSTRMGRPDPWTVLETRLKQAGVSPKQVQVAWIKQARANPSSLGAFPKHSEALADDLSEIVRKLRATYPNLRIAYLSSRIYAGNASTSLNPEPFSYESAFSVRTVILNQIAGQKDLAYQIKPVAPLLLWGPYLWADGTKGRAAGDLVWTREDFAEDGTHPSPIGQKKVAEQLLKFFKSDPTSQIWFLKPPENNK
jgi:hypothetical protein